MPTEFTGGFNIFVGAANADGTAASIPEEPSPLDLRQIGIDVRLIAEFELLFNFTTINKSFDRDGQTFEIAGQSTRIYAQGMLEAGGFEISGTFLLESDPNGLLVAGSGQVLLGSLGDVTAEGGLKIESEQRTTTTTMLPDRATPPVSLSSVRESGSTVFWKSMGRPSCSSIHSWFQSPLMCRDSTMTRSPEQSMPGLSSVVKVSGRGGSGDARLSLFPRQQPEDIRLFGVNFSGNFELIAQQEALHLDFLFTASLTVANFDNAAIGSVSGTLDIVDGKVIGEFGGSLTVAGLTIQNGVTIDEFGCTTLDEPILGISSFGCQPHIFVSDQALLEDDPVLFTNPIDGTEIRQRVVISNNAPQPHRIGVRYLVEDDTAIKDVHYTGSSTGTVFIAPGKQRERSRSVANR